MLETTIDDKAHEDQLECFREFLSGLIEEFEECDKIVEKSMPFEINIIKEILNLILAENFMIEDLPQKTKLKSQIIVDKLKELNIENRSNEEIKELTYILIIMTNDLVINLFDDQFNQNWTDNVQNLKYDFEVFQSLSEKHEENLFDIENFNDTENNDSSEPNRNSKMIDCDLDENGYKDLHSLREKIFKRISISDYKNVFDELKEAYILSSEYINHVIKVFSCLIDKYNAINNININFFKALMDYVEINVFNNYFIDVSKFYLFTLN
jgi:hypothetical protein